MVFPGARRDAMTHVNLFLMVPSIGDAIYSQSIVVAAKVSTGAVVGSTDYTLVSIEPILILDVLGAMGISGLEGGSLWVQGAAQRGHAAGTLCRRYDGFRPARRARCRRREGEHGFLSNLHQGVKRIVTT
jgi:hypothetical protein